MSADAGAWPDAEPQDAFAAVRGRTMAMLDGLSDADATVQSMPDASPAKWHAAHTTWFFEEFILAPRLGDAARFDPTFSYLFNSYYEAVGPRHARPKRGMLTRPSLDAVRAYRAHVDARMVETLDAAPPDLLALGLAHEEQHQELLLTDLLHLLSENPLSPAYREASPISADDPEALDWIGFDGGVARIGADGAGFAFDCEGPAHDVLLRPFALASRAVTNGEWRAFMEAGGYADPRWWLADGFAAAQAGGWSAPLYWRDAGDGWRRMTLTGEQPVSWAAPVSHVSFYEADAYARWAGARLPTEAEWECAVQSAPMSGVFAGAGLYEPQPQRAEAGGIAGLYGDVWEWTASAFLPYPGYAPAAGAVGEYNGKFMSGQMVLRGGSVATAPGHMRATYRNFFHPEKRWQFSGLRLARDAS